MTTHFHPRSCSNSIVLLIACAGMLYPMAGPAAEYRGADAVLTEALSTNGPQSSSDEQTSPSKQLRADLKAFHEKSAVLPPTEAAKQWLALLDRYAQLGDVRTAFGQQMDSSAAVQPQDIMDALPVPAVWPELAKQIEVRPAGEGAHALQQIGLRLLAHTLVGDLPKRREDIAALEAFAAKAKSAQAYFFNSLFEQLNRSLLAAMDNPDAILHSLERKLIAQQSQEGYESNLQIPDLVALVGRDKAETFLRKALVKHNGELSVAHGTATQKLAQKLALELVKDLKKPQWALASSLDAVDLYEALERRFPGPESAQLDSDDSGLPSLTLPENGPGNYERQSARIYYFLGLIAKGRTTNAVVVARKFEKEGEVYFPGEVIRQMERAGFTTELNNFFHELLRQNPELPFWDEYVQVAAHAGQTAEMVTLVRAAASQSSLSKGQRTRLQQTLCKALLANDEVEAGVNELRSLVRSAEQQNSSRRNYSIESAGDLSLQLARIGQLLNRTNWVEEGIAAARNDLLRSENPEDSYGGPRTVFSLASFLQKNGRGAEAESVLASALAKEAQNARTAGAGRRQTGTCPALLGALLRVYHEAGRHEDVLTLLDHAPFWGAKDLAQAQMQSLNFEDSSSDYYEKHVSTPLGYYAAAALAKTGHPTGARKLLDPLFDQSPGCDRLYELLLALDDERAPAELDAIFSRDQFEERPLIWKAHWLRLHQRLEEAEQVARKAISIDPTDGEEGPGDRLRAYAELAEIRAARGDRKEAETLRGAVQAVHEAELADQFHAAGLLKRAIDLYTDSLNKFADAYCIHARLAVQLSDLGKHEEAAEHYRRAYELMPDSFGRVESHCFGCERAFDGERAQGIAEKVFIQLAQKTPAKPQIHYLLGYLREEQSRYQEALDSYRTAVKLDPDYLNAWVKMQSVDEHVYVSPAERDAVVFNILRLDPMHHRLTPSFEVVSDLPALWNQVAALEKKKPLRPDSLYPLAASEAELERQAASGASRQELYMEYQTQMMERDAAITPGRAVSQNGFIQAALSFFGSRSALFGDE